MRISASLLFVLLAPALFSQEVRLSVECQNSWPPGGAVPVTVVIEKGTVGGFARFFQDLPQGFKVESIESSGADFYWDNNQVNLVWLNLPSAGMVKVRYLVTPDASLSGSFRLAGRFDYIVGEKERRSVELQPVVIRLDRNAFIEDAPSLPSVAADTTPPVKVIQAAQTEPLVSFRVQVAIASLRLSKPELESRIGCALRYNVTTLKSGNMYKYQSGSFERYDDAAVYLNQMKDSGVNDAFIVAYRGDEQISVEMARSLSR